VDQNYMVMPIVHWTRETVNFLMSTATVSDSDGRCTYISEEHVANVSESRQSRSKIGAE
jgi:hypothetical protein